MYQAIHYNYWDKTCYLRDDKIGWNEFEYYPTFYKIDENGEYPTLDGKRANKVYKCDKTLPLEYYEIDIPIDTRILIDLYLNEDESPQYHNIIMFDIETEMGESLTPEYIQSAPKKITSISLYDSTQKIDYCLILDEKGEISKVEDENIKILPFTTEKQLLLYFLDLWEQVDPTIISGWNSGYFDIPYLYYRLLKLFGQDTAVRLSPIKKIRVSDYNLDQPVQIGGINHLDYMRLFKKFIVKQESSYKLGDIGKKYVDLGKIEYEGNLDKLFKEDKEKFIQYNIRDVEILKKLEEKLKFIELTINICHLCHVPYEMIYFSTTLNEGAILTYLKRKNIVSPNKPTTINPSLQHKQEEYAGGYLKEPIPGLYEWVSDLDFTSLYPSIIRNLNMGIETLIGRISQRNKYDNQWSLHELKQMDEDDVISIEKLNDNRKIQTSEVKVGKLLKIITDNNLIISANGTLFKNDKPSIIVEVLNDWFDKRVEYKNKMKQAYKAGDKEKGEFYNKRQHAYKIKLNDLYGVFAINGWRYSDGNKFISSAITLTGQRLIQETIKFINEEIAKELGEI